VAEEEELNKMTEDEIGEEGMGERVKMVGNVGRRMKAMEGQMSSSSTFLVLQTEMEVSGVFFLTFQFGKSSWQTR
jgi:hypothetical protein